ncbi:MAG: PadR family transcriptional regulator [Saprospiraceae bacterium]|nr:PadR family transcriptional regulator [Saprospiraceae bacterium]
MGKNRLGELEEIVLLTVAILHGKAYGMAIVTEMEQRLERRISIGSLQIVLRRLEKKGYLISELGEATKIRGGKRKRFFTLTNYGKDSLEETKDQRMRMWEAIPKTLFGN